MLGSPMPTSSRVLYMSLPPAVTRLGSPVLTHCAVPVTAGAPVPGGMLASQSQVQRILHGILSMDFFATLLTTPLS